MVAVNSVYKVSVEIKDGKDTLMKLLPARSPVRCSKQYKSLIKKNNKWICPVKESAIHYILFLYDSK